ncbi:MAG: response regulator [Hyphomicrobiaceae bacterium]
MIEGPLKGLRVLLVEDDFLLALDMRMHFEQAGAIVVGHAASLSQALQFVAGGEPFDAAVVDLDLRGEAAYPVADALLARGVRFVFTTGYDQSVIPPRFGSVERFEKPVDLARVGLAVAGPERAT